MTTAVTSTIKTDILKGLREIDEIDSFEDIERLFLRGVGNSPTTYKVYRNKVKLFYDFTGGLHPVLVKPADIEGFYDHRIGKVDRKTAYLDIQALKCFFRGVERVVPTYESPFKKMPDKLLKKLTKTNSGGTKKALNRTEIRKVIEFLGQGESEREIEDYAIFRFLYATGLRGSELCSMKWEDIELDEDEGTHYVNGIGKGSKPFRQEVVDPEAIRAARKYFRKAFKRKPRADDFVFWTVPAYHGDIRRPLPYVTLYRRIVGIGEAVRKAGIITRALEFTPHLLRRSIITQLSKAGMRAKALQKFSRHSSVSTLMKHYIDDEEPARKYFTLGTAGVSA
jgi:integrase